MASRRGSAEPVPLTPEEGTVIFEAKDGAYATIVADDIMLR